MKSVRRLCVLVAASLLGGCNLVISETPMFTDADRGNFAPKVGIWLGIDDECVFDSSMPESRWPGCAMWVVVRGSGEELNLVNGKGESQRADGFFTTGDPAIFQVRWVDTAKDSRAYYGFYGVKPHGVDSDGRFSSLSMWSVECGIRHPAGSEIQPFPGITPECRPTSKDAIRSAAKLSWRADQIREWRWLRAETSKS